MKLQELFFPNFNLNDSFAIIVIPALMPPFEINNVSLSDRNKYFGYIGIVLQI